jgi:hypothetical protein
MKTDVRRKIFYRDKKLGWNGQRAKQGRRRCGRTRSGLLILLWAGY